LKSLNFREFALGSALRAKPCDDAGNGNAQRSQLGPRRDAAVPKPASGSFRLNLWVKPVEPNPRISGFEFPVDLLASIVPVIVPDSHALA